MTPKEFKEKMQSLDDTLDCEEFHLEADEIICEIMKDLGYSEGIEIFKAHERWYS